MWGQLRSGLRRHTPGIGWRDEQLAQLRRRLTQERTLRGSAEEEARRLGETLRSVQEEASRPTRRTSADRASIQRLFLDHRRSYAVLRSVDPQRLHPAQQLPLKLASNSLAASHGIRTPTVHAVWDRPDAVRLAELPDHFVLKTDQGANSAGVLPLTRIASDRYRQVDGSGTWTEDEIRRRLADIIECGRGKPPVFAEELVTEMSGRPVPDDVKIYTSYGQVAQVLLRRVGRHGVASSVTKRYVDDAGVDIDGAVDTPTDHSIPVPDVLPDLLAAARHLSRAVGIPFVRVDLYDAGDEVVFGELTLVPGGQQRYGAAHDESMGKMAELARWRLELDLVTGRPFGVLHGEHPAPDHYAGQRSVRPAPPVVACREWCHRP
jgi:hypothetical protein